MAFGFEYCLTSSSTSNWAAAGAAIREYAEEKHEEQREALDLTELVEMAKQETELLDSRANS